MFPHYILTATYFEVKSEVLGIGYMILVVGGGERWDRGGVIGPYCQNLNRLCDSVRNFVFTLNGLSFR